MKYSDYRHQVHLRVFEDRTEYFMDSGRVEVFHEGVISNDAKLRIKLIKNRLEQGFLDNLIIDLKEGRKTVDLSKVSQSAEKNVRELVELVTSEVGRALIGLTIMQLSIKSISPQQCIRLHKASSSTGSFSWVEGVSMRTLDKNFVTPALRRHDLVRLNADGFMMTRSLAENYPYSALYKAQLRGARDQWLSIVEELESRTTDPEESLKYLLSLLLNAATHFNDAANKVLALLEKKLNSIKSRHDVIKILVRHANSSDYAARLLEISMHALMQPAVECGALGELVLKPLSQMRSANKKHGNIGDIELLEGREIVESWDAKYGKAYLREEIEEVAEKIPDHDNIKLVGFVTNVAIQRTEELNNRIADLSNLHGVDFQIVQYNMWVDLVYKRCLETALIDEAELSRQWLKAYTLSLSQRKRDIAPIDEPCIEWVRLLYSELEQL
jgi:hypothetical protein